MRIYRNELKIFREGGGWSNITPLLCQRFIQNVTVISCWPWVFHTKLCWLAWFHAWITQTSQGSKETLYKSMDKVGLKEIVCSPKKKFFEYSSWLQHSFFRDDIENYVRYIWWMHCLECMINEPTEKENKNKRRQFDKLSENRTYNVDCIVGYSGHWGAVHILLVTLSVQITLAANETF